MYNHDYSTDSVRSLCSKDIAISIVGAFVTVTSSIVLIMLLQRNNASTLIPQIQPCVIVLTLMLGYFVFGESISVNQLVGILLIIMGLIAINMNKKK